MRRGAESVCRIGQVVVTGGRRPEDRSPIRRREARYGETLAELRTNLNRAVEAVLETFPDLDAHLDLDAYGLRARLQLIGVRGLDRGLDRFPHVSVPGLYLETGLALGFHTELTPVRLLPLHLVQVVLEALPTLIGGLVEADPDRVLDRWWLVGMSARARACQTMVEQIYHDTRPGAAP